MSTEFNIKDLPNREIQLMINGKVTGCPVRVLATDITFKNAEGVNFPILAVACVTTNNEEIYRFTADGYNHSRYTQLIFKPIKKDYWLVVCTTGTYISSTEERAIEMSKELRGFLYLHHVEWEE